MAPKPRRRLKWLYIAAAILIGFPLLLLAAFLSLSKINAITPAQRQFPSIAIKPEATSTASRPRKLNSIPTDALVKRLVSITTQSQDATLFDELAQSCPNREAADIYSKLISEYKTFRDEWDKVGLKDWSPGQPLTDAQKKFLIEHKKNIDDLLKLAAAGGIPMITIEQAMALDPKTLSNLPVTNFLPLQIYGRLLAAETSRLVEAGDFQRAAQTLMATLPIAQSISEPFIINHLVAVAMQGVANGELHDWLSRSSPPADLARRLRDQLESSALTNQGLYNTMQVEYLNNRSSYIDRLNGSFGGLVRSNVNEHLRSLFHMDIYEHFQRNPVRTSGNVVRGTWEAAWMQSNPSWALEVFDNAWQESFRIIENDERRSVSIDPRVYAPMITNNPSDLLNRIDNNLALVRVNIAGLDLISGRSGTQTDPFTNEPLRTVQDGNSTLIYSVGPDRQDQQGAVTYNPTNGTMSPGDIVLRIPR